MTEAEAQALKLIDQGESVQTAASNTGCTVNQVYRALAERDRRKGNHQHREAS
jgi:DNA invertase Pin-like site-specific DNA recombinase